MNRFPKRAAVLALASLAIILTGCTPTGPFERAWTLCVDAHPASSTYESFNGFGPVEHTDREACGRWLMEEGEDQFIEDWNEEYARQYKELFG